MVVAGPWVGEFGWELFYWQGWLRRQSKLGDEPMTVICTHGMSGMYADFASVVKEVHHPRDQSNCWQSVTPYTSPELDALRRSASRFVDPREEPPVMDLEASLACGGQEFIQFGSTPKCFEYDILIHARHAAKPGTRHRNWPRCAWQEVVASFPALKVACMGDPFSSISVEGADDRRGLSFAEQADLIRRSRVVVGPASGPMHMACLCGVPTVQWGPDFSEERASQILNPLGAPVHGLWSGWNPSPEAVIDRLSCSIA